MVPDVATGDFTKMFCLNCARRIVSPKSTSKYEALTNYLKFRAAFTNIVKLSFAKIDGIIADNLPMTAYKNENWWSNTAANFHAKTWIEAGWETQEVNLKEGYVIFKKVKTIPKRKRTQNTEVKKPFIPVHFRPARSNKPSKTKVSKLYARLKNLERKKAALPIYPGSFKPKSKHEKKLFKPEKKPTR